MSRQTSLALGTGILMLMSASAFATREEHTFEVLVEIPTPSFYVIPSEPDWIHRDQVLPWNLNTATLGGLRKNFDVKHDTSAIQARLESEPYLSNGNDEQNISLQVSFNGQLLSHESPPRRVVSATEAMMGGRFALEIQPKVPVGGFQPGSYYGAVQLIFSAEAP
ncbi:CS1 type fimbrial major subunit [Pseudomonas sp. MDT1-16]|uniref:CS1 type fimbrial major subunit n=1 Tax=Pseudomonas sp. AL03 TaxID=3042230 RepID=UPI00249BE06A|nr:CS1 type fimbrial major subunit [Pseudomonas sp. AL03]MDI3271144.1 CS1 type fimbrial major subunit [Pseudomonas sp. AL03]